MDFFSGCFGFILMTSNMRRGDCYNIYIYLYIYIFYYQEKPNFYFPKSFLGDHMRLL